MIVVANNYDEVIEYLSENIDEAIKEAIRIGGKIIEVDIEKPKKYIEKYDEYETECIDTVEIDIEKDLGIRIEDIIDYCYYNCKEEKWIKILN